MKLTREARSIAVVINAGSRKGSAAQKLVADSLAKAELPVSAVYTVSGGGDLGRALEQAVAEGHDFVVVGGGDGTVASAAGLVAGTDVVLGVLPLGTANDLARTLEIPRDLGSACAALAEWHMLFTKQAVMRTLYYETAFIKVFMRRPGSWVWPGGNGFVVSDDLRGAALRSLDFVNKYNNTLACRPA